MMQGGLMGGDGGEEGMMMGDDGGYYENGWALA